MRTLTHAVPHPDRSDLRPFLAVVTALLLAGLANAQNIGINTTGATPDASAMLDISATDRGLLIPRVALTASNVAGPVSAPTTSVVVYNTATAGTAPNNVLPGFYYWSGTSWLRMFSGKDGWSTTGNYGTAPGTNFLGTADAQDLVVKTGGSASTNERLRVLSGGQTVLNNTSAYATDVFSVYGTGTSNGTTNAISSLGSSVINGYASGDGIGLYGNTTAASTSAGKGVVGILDAPSTTATYLSAGVYGKNNSTPSGTSGTAGVAYGVRGLADGGAGNGNAIGVGGMATGTTAYTIGTSGINFSSGGFGMYASNASTDMLGTGMAAVGNNESTFSYLINGSGLAATGSTTGAYMYYSSTGAGQGIVIQDAFGAQWNVGYYNGASYKKIVGNGNVSTIVNDAEGNRVVLTCPEAPEVLFQDYGTGQLTGGHAHIALDPVLTRNIVVNADHPLKVFVQLEGECKGVYVTNKSATGFDVVELGSGSSDVPFSWSIVATRGDEEYTGPNGEVRHVSYQERFGPAPPVAKNFKMEPPRIIAPAGKRFR